MVYEIFDTLKLSIWASFFVLYMKVCFAVTMSQGGLSSLPVSARQDLYRIVILLLVGVEVTLEEAVVCLGKVVAIITHQEITLARHFGALRIARPLESEMERSFLMVRS